MPKATLEQWRMFKAVVDHGGFNQAAEVVHKSQSTVHHAVQKLEQTLSIQLLKVTGRKAELTDTGELMYRRASFLLDEAVKLESLAAALADGVESKLSVAVDEAFDTELMLKAIHQVTDEYPTVSINLVETVLAGAAELVALGEVDLAISPLPAQENFSEELCRLEFTAVMAPNYALSNLSGDITLDSLKAYRQIVIRDSAQNADTDSGWLGADHRFTVGHVRSSIDMVRSGFGFAWLPAHKVRPYIDQGELVEIAIKDGAKRSSPMYLHFADGDKLGPAARALIAALRMLID